MIHILNGDSLLDYFNHHKFSIEGKTFVFREALIEGPVPITQKSATFISMRAEYLNKEYDVLERETQRMYHEIIEAALHEKKEVVLWFESAHNFVSLDTF